MPAPNCSSTRIPAPSDAPRPAPPRTRGRSAASRPRSGPPRRAWASPAMPSSFVWNDPRWSKARISSGSVYPSVTYVSLLVMGRTMTQTITRVDAGGASMAISTTAGIEELLGDESESLLGYRATGVDAAQIVAPGPDFIDRVVVQPPIARPRCCAASAACSITAGWPAPGYISILPGRSGHRALGRGVVRQEPGLLRPAEPGRAGASRAAATRSPPPSACWAWSRGATRTASRSSSRSTTTSC